MRVSIVVPSFNPGPVLERALASLVSQAGIDLQLIVMDAGSTDGSPAILERFAPDIDVLVRERDNGQADGINRGFTHAEGDIFGWLCADDELMPGTLAHVASLFEEHPAADVVIGACERVFADGTTCITPARADTWDVIGMQNVIDQPSVFWRAGLHRRLGRLDDSYNLAFDWDFWCRMRASGARFIATDRVLSRYYFSDTNKSGSSGRGHVRESFRILRQYGPLSGGLAYVFLGLYHLFDLHGCYDRPPTCGPIRLVLHRATLALLRLTLGTRLAYGYNWQFASRQERGLQWW
ncbi:MAG: glycosyltransferase family 2 protein [Vicinamibacterales bacterium]